MLKVKPLSKKFGKMKVGGAKPATITLINKAKSGPPITFATPMTSFAPASPQEFTMLSTTCGTQLLPRKKCKVTLQFSPQSAGAKSSSLTIYDNASNANQVVPLSGTGE